MENKNKKIWIAVLILAVIIIAAGFYFRQPKSMENKNWVSSAPSDWLTGAAKDITFKYPKGLEAKYIHTLDWPPFTSVMDGPFSCTEAGSENDQAGKTERRTVNGHQYCITTKSQGAAGSIYNQYAYVFEKNGKVVIFAFSTQSTQCGNYPDVEKSECEKERGEFKLDNTLDTMAGSVEFNK